MRDYDRMLSLKERRPILERDAYTCQDCGRKGEPEDGTLDVHHILQYRLGGEHVPENLVTLCKPCHQNRDREYRARLGRERMALVKNVPCKHGGRMWVPIADAHKYDPPAPRKGVTANLPDKTFQQIDELQIKLGMTKVQVMVMAVERLAKQELKRKKESE